MESTGFEPPDVVGEEGNIVRVELPGDSAAVGGAPVVVGAGKTEEAVDRIISVF